MPYYPPASTGSGSNTPADNVFRIQDDGDATKQIAFQASGITTGTTRTITMPDADGTATLRGNTVAGSGNVVLDTSPTIVTPTVASLTNMNHDHSATGATGGLIALGSQIPALNKTAYAFEYDDFYGGNTASATTSKLGWAITAGTSSSIATAGHPGVLQRDTSSSINTVAEMHLFNKVDPTDTWDITWILKLNQVDANTTIRCGLVLAADISTSPPTNGLYFERIGSDTNWFGCIRTASASTRTDSTVAASTNYVRLRLRRTSSTQINFSINGAAEFTASATNSTSAMFQWMHITNLAAASKTVDVDYWECLTSGLSR